MTRGWAFTVTAAALFLGEVVAMAPCQLCWFQRISCFRSRARRGLGATVVDSLWRAGPSCRDQSLAIFGGIQLPWLSLASLSCCWRHLKDPCMNVKRLTIADLCSP